MDNSATASSEVYEAPAAITLIKAHQALESLCLTRDVMHFKYLIEQKFANMVYEGLWYSPLLEAINSFIDKTQLMVNGSVKIKFFKGTFWRAAIKVALQGHGQYSSSDQKILLVSTWTSTSKEVVICKLERLLRFCGGGVHMKSSSDPKLIAANDTAQPF